MNTIKFRIVAEQDDIEVKGNAIASGDDAVDKEVEDAIFERLDQGDVWAWACVHVIAYVDGLDLEGDAYLGCCSYKDEEDFKQDGYYEDMCLEAKADLLAKIKATKEAINNLQL